MSLDFVVSWDGSANGRAIRYGVVRRFAAYISIYDPLTEVFDSKAFPRFRAVPPPRILSDAELGALISACCSVSPLEAI